MNIGIVTQHSFPKDQEVRVRKMVHYLNKNEVNVIVYSPLISALGKTSNNLLQTRQLPFANKKWQFLNNPNPANLHWFFSLSKAIKKNKIDVIIVRDLRLAMAGIIAARISKIPLVLDLAENMPAMTRIVGEYRRGVIISVVISWFVSLLEWFCVTQANMVWVVCEENRQRILEFKKNPKMIIIVRNTPEIEAIVQMSSASAVENQWVRMIYVGILTKQRGLDILINSVEILRDEGLKISLDIIGDGLDKPRLEQLVADSELHSHVNFHGWVLAEKIYDYLANYDLGVIPHYPNDLTNTTIPNKIYDYMAVGLPVLTTNLRPVEKIVLETRCGWVTDATVIGFVSTLRNIANIPKIKRNPYGNRGRKAVFTDMNWEIDGQVIYKALDELVLENKGKNERNNT